MLEEKIKGNLKVVIEKIENGFEVGFTQTRSNNQSPWENKVNYVRKIDPLWFSEKTYDIMSKCGIETTERRAQDLANLFDGSLNGFYYVSMASHDKSDEPAKLLLGYISETFNKRNIDIKTINYHIPSEWLKGLIQNIENGKVPKKFQKEFIDELIDTKDKSQNIENVIDSILKNPKYEVMDNSLIDNLINQVFEEFPDAVNDAKQNPKKSGFLVGKVMKLSGGKASPQDVSKIIGDRLKG